MEVAAAAELTVLCVPGGAEVADAGVGSGQDLDWSPGSIPYQLGDLGQVISLPLASVSLPMTGANYSTHITEVHDDDTH